MSSREDLKSQLTSAAALVKEGRYIEARATVAAINHPRAQEMVSKIDQRLADSLLALYDDMTAAAADDDAVANKKPPSNSRVFLGAMVSLVVLVGLALVASVWVMTNPSLFNNETATPVSTPLPPTATMDFNAPLTVGTKAEALALVCEMVFDGERVSLGYTRFKDGCLREGNRLAQAFQDGTDFCYKSYAQSVVTLKECLDRRQVTYDFDTVRYSYR